MSRPTRSSGKFLEVALIASCVWNQDSPQNRETPLRPSDQIGNINFTNGSNNLIQDDASAILDPTLQDNGGPTPTHALLVASPAIDAGDNLLAVDGSGNALTTDQRGPGFNRIFGGTVDIGAVEHGEAPSLVVTTDQDVVNAFDGLTSLREAIAFANATPGTLDEITFSDGTAGTHDFHNATPDTITLGGAQLSIKSDIIISGPGPDLLTVSGNNASRVFQIASGVHDVTFDSLTIANGSAADGGGISNKSVGTVNVVDSKLTGNQATQEGGAIHTSNGTLTIANSTISGNSADNSTGGGGGIANIASTGTLIVISSTITANSANDSFAGGGGVINVGFLTVVNSTISGNSADATTFGGGGILSNTNVTITNSTIIGNTAEDAAGGGVNLDAGTATINNSIISGNTAGTGDNIDGTHTGNNNLIDAGISTILDTNLTDNGGPTLTHALLPGSPAINAGDNSLAVDENGAPLTTDQRGTGFARIIGGMVDIGAMEAPAATLWMPLSDVIESEDAPDLVVDLSEVFADTGGVALSADTSDATLVSISLNGSDLTLDFGDNQHGTATITVTGDDGINESSTTFQVTVNPVNDAPILDPIGNKTVDEETQLTFMAQASDIDLPTNNLTFSLDAASIAAGMTINANSGVFSWTPTEAQGPGVFSVTVTVTDDGSPNLSDSETFDITVGEVNVAPVLASIGNKSVDELTELTFTATATDADLSANNLMFSLDAASIAAGMSIDAGSGDFTWTPTEAQGPGVFSVTVTVTDDGSPNLSDSETFDITVGEVNVAPVLDSIGNQSVEELTELAFTANASDVDLPANDLTFSLDAGSIAAGMSIDAGSGDFTWTPTEVQGPGVFSVTVTVTDDGSPNLSDSETFDITVSAVNTPGDFGGDLAETIDEDTSANGVATFTDATDGFTAANFTLQTGATDGTALVQADGSWTYDPDPNFNGSDSFTVEVTDDEGHVESQVINITVDQVNDAGTFNGDLSATIDEDTSANGIATFTDAIDGFASPNFALDSDATNGSATVSADGNWTYTPDTNFNGLDSFSVKVTDDDGNVETQTINIDVTAVDNDPPEVVVPLDDVTLDEDSPATDIDVNDTFDDPDGQTVTVTAVSSDPDIVDVTENPDGTITITPQPDANGTVTITVTGTNDVPVASDVVYGGVAEDGAGRRTKAGQRQRV